MAASLVVCEPLCYLLNKYGNVPSESIKKVILSFYSEFQILKYLMQKKCFT